jgi:hypothetical protein
VRLCTLRGVKRVRDFANDIFLDAVWVVWKHFLDIGSGFLVVIFGALGVLGAGDEFGLLMGGFEAVLTVLGAFI